MFSRKGKVLIRRFSNDANGSIAILSAISMIFVVAAAALAIDVGSLYTERRTLQGVADLAAMAAASDLARAEDAVAATIEANGVEATFTLERGNYTADPNLSREQRFKPGQAPNNAVRVNLQKIGQAFFARSMPTQQLSIGVSAIAATANSAAFSIGSRLLSVRGGVVNQVLGGLLGSNVSLSVMDHSALVNTNLQLVPLMNALASEVAITSGSYSDVLAATANMGDILVAAAEVAESNGDSSGASAMLRLVNANSWSKTVPLSSLLDLGPYGSLRIGDPARGLDATVSALQLVTGSALLANGGRQLQIDVAASVPNLLSLTMDLAVGEVPQQSALIAVGRTGKFVRTAQTRMKLTARVGGSGLLAGINLRLPLYLDLAYGEARMAAVDCQQGPTPSATVAARSGIARVWIGEVGYFPFENFDYAPSVSSARIIDTLLVDVDGQAFADAGNTSETLLTFDQSDVDNATVKRTSTNNLTESLVTSLLSNLQLQVQVLGLSLNTPDAIENAVSNTLAGVAEPLDEVLYSLLTTLGVNLGEADIRVHGIRCGSGVLAG